MKRSSKKIADFGGGAIVESVNIAEREQEETFSEARFFTKSQLWGVESKECWKTQRNVFVGKTASGSVWTHLC